MAEPTKPSDPASPGVASPRTEARAADYQWLHETRARARSAPKAAQQAAQGPEVVLCDTGELEDVATQLARLGQPALRVRPDDLPTLEPWERPGRLFVTTVRLGFAAPLPPGLPRTGVVLLAVGDGDSATATTAMLRRGFRFVVRRPVHPEALRLLLSQILFRGRDQRDAERFPYGGEVSWRIGLRRGRCTMTEISSAGCRLLLAEPLRLGTRIVLKLPVERGGRRVVKLRGHVVRRDLGRRDEPDAARSLAVHFDGLSARARADLDLVLAACATGPASGGRGAAAEAPLRLPEPAAEPSLLQIAVRRSRRQGASALARPRSEPAAPEFERRLAPRGVFEREVVAIDPEQGRVTHALVGRELSIGGMSVEQHPMLAPGHRLSLALYAPDQPEPIVVSARVVRSDGLRGCGLRFEDVPPDALARLEKLVKALPSVESLAEDQQRAQGVVLGEILLQKVRRPA
jgi:hypothetical protein